jgi:hypothetical protein
MAIVTVCFDTRLGSLQLRQGSYFPPFLGGAEGIGEGAGRGNPGSVDRRGFDATG